MRNEFLETSDCCNRPKSSNMLYVKLQVVELAQKFHASHFGAEVAKRERLITCYKIEAGCKLESEP